MIKKIQNKLFVIPLIGRLILFLVIKIEGGVIQSSSLREYAKKMNKVEADLYTYGPWWKRDFNIGGEVSIGRYTSIANGVHYFGANHPTDTFSTSAIFYNKIFGYKVDDIKRSKLNIGNDVWIGSNVQILCGCKKIGNGAVIGAGAVVTKDVPPYSIVVGVPGRVIKYRFEKKIIDRFMDSNWWKYSPDILMKYYKFKDNPQEFLNKVSNESKYK